MPSPGAPCWFDLMSEDPAAARAFYGAVLGWGWSILPDGEGYALATVGEAAVAGVGGVPPGDELSTGWVVCFASADVAQDAARVASLGGRVVAGPMRVLDLGRVILAVDPAGALFGLWQAGDLAGAALADAPGAMSWAEVNTRDLDLSIAFYAELLGLEPSEMAFPGSRYAMLTREGEPLAGVLEMNEQWPDDLPSHWMPYFAVSDAEAAAARAREAGGQTPYGPFDTAFGRIVVVVDPQGAVCSLVQRPAAGANDRPD